MHYAINFHTNRWGYICFCPTTSKHWRWHFYISPNATPWAATFGIGPGLDKVTKQEIKQKYQKFGITNYDTDRLKEGYDLVHNHPELALTNPDSSIRE